MTTTTATLKWEPFSDDVGIRKYIVYRDGVEIGRTPDSRYKVIGLVQ